MGLKDSMVVTHAALEQDFNHDATVEQIKYSTQDEDEDKTLQDKPPSLYTIAEETFRECLKTLKNKNHDYSMGEDEFRNFKLITQIRPKVSAYDGLMVRICDKMARIGNLIDANAKVKNESVVDTIDDAINYFVILKALYTVNNKLY